MCYFGRVETINIPSFQTTRSRNSELWFANNKAFENAILGYAAKYKCRYRVELYALAIEGNHIQFPALFPEANRAHFMRDLNSNVARAVPRYCPAYPGGTFWGRRFSNEFIPTDDDLEDAFWYTVLQPVYDGLVEKISEYPFYNCFHEAIYGIKRKYKVFRRSDYNQAKRWKKNIKKIDYIEEFELEYARLPQYENLSQKEYAKMMLAKLKERQDLVVEARKQAGLGFLGRERLLRVKPGSLPRSTKTSTYADPRPRIYSKDPETIERWEDWLFQIYFAYKEASRAYRAGDLTVKFPPGTYKPPAFTIKYKVEIEDLAS